MGLGQEESGGREEREALRMGVEVQRGLTRLPFHYVQMCRNWINEKGD